MRSAQGCQRLEELPIIVVKCVDPVGIDVNFRDKRTVPEYRYDDFTLHVNAARQVVVLILHVVNKKCLQPLRGLSADTPSIGNAKVIRRRSLIRSQNEEAFFRHGDIETEPVIMGDFPLEVGAHELEPYSPLGPPIQFRLTMCKQICPFHSEYYRVCSPWRQGMPKINEHYTELSKSYLFVDIAKRVQAWENAHPETSVIKLGIGDVTQPLPPSAVKALHDAAEEMSAAETFRGYGPEQGYEFLRKAIVHHDYESRDVDISPDDVFVSDGSKCDTGNFQELFADGQVIAIPDPVYPVYRDTSIMAGRKSRLHYMHGTADNGFVPPPPEEHTDILYLCFPNNPTGATATREQLEQYVQYAREHDAIILFDAAYVEFIRDDRIPRSIFEIPGAETCAVEFRSFSKTAGFTGLRCAYTVIPKTVVATDSGGTRYSLRDLWSRRHSTKFNGASYPVQRAAAAVFSDEGSKEIRALSDYYLENAKLIRSGVQAKGYECVGGDNSPYIWVNAGRPSWDFFDEILNNTGVVTTPGAGFGDGGEGYIRISAFNDREKVVEAMKRIDKNI